VLVASTGQNLASLAVEKNFEVLLLWMFNSVPVCGNFVKFDVSNKELVNEAFRRVKPDVVIHAASLTDVDKCELQ